MDHPPNCRLTAESTHVSSALTIPAVASLVLLLNVCNSLLKGSLLTPVYGQFGSAEELSYINGDGNWRICQVVCINGTNSLILSESMPLAL